MTAAGSRLPKSICLIDDDRSVLKAVGRLLASAGWVVRAFSEAAPFLAYISTNPVDLVVLDIWMEQMSGLEVLAPVFGITADADHHYNWPRRCRRKVDRDADWCGRLLS
jgi:DNA-binding NtrC family response regulator